MSKVLKVVAKRMDMNLSDIKEYDNNNKIHGDNQVEAIKSSIDRFSYIDEIVVDKNNVIILGHGRYKAAKELGYDAVQVKQLDIDGADEKALRYLHNKLSEFDVEYQVDNLRYELESGVDFSLGNISGDDFFLNLDMSHQERADTGQINANEVELYSSQQDTVSGASDIMNDIDDISLPDTNGGVIRGIQIFIKQEHFMETFTEFKKAIYNKTDIGALLINGLKKELNK